MWTGHPMGDLLAWGTSRGGPLSPLDATARGEPAPAVETAVGEPVPLHPLCYHLLGGWHGVGCEGTLGLPGRLGGLRGRGGSRLLGPPQSPRLPAVLPAR